MTALFADTFYWIALTDFGDSSHRRALNVTSERAASTIVTSDEVLAEFLTCFASAPEQMRLAVVASVHAILANPAIRVIPQSRSSFLAGLDLYSKRPDKRYSLTLGDHFKTGHRGSLQNRPTDHHPGRICFTLPAGGLASASLTQSGP